jgi:hypothetical protein
LRRSLVAVGLGGAAFALYRATLLPGFDFGDTGSFQTILGAAVVRARDAYPLYFAIGRAFLWLMPGAPAHVLNLVSAVEAAVASALIVVVAEELSGSLAAAAAAALVFAGSYTFWSQAIIAEVYALHIAFSAGTLLLILRWQRQPTLTRLGAFFLVYAIGFGNHLSMILLLPAYTLFLLTAAPRGWRSMFAPRVIGLALLFAGVGAAQYLWSFASIWTSPQPTQGALDAFSRFWFDVTKPDWRDTMVLNVPASMLADRLQMYWFDLRQQFGPLLPVVAVAGLAGLFRSDWRRGALLLIAYLGTALFAFGYEVGDAHVFYLSSHVFVGVLLANGVGAIAVWTGRRSIGIAAAATLAGYGATRIYDDYPALDRSGDTRPAAVLADLTAGLPDRGAVLLSDLHWQIQNGLSYFANQERPGLEYARMPDVLLYAPVLIVDNRAIGREVTATSSARDEIVSAYGPAVAVEADARAPAPALRDFVSALAPGTRYALCVLKPLREFALDTAAVNSAVGFLTGGAEHRMPPGQYSVIVGQTGRAPVLGVGSDQPLGWTVDLSGVRTEVRMESWLNADTIRRMGFGHVIAGRQHTLIVERGVSFVAFDDAGHPVRTAYRDGIFAPIPRYLIKIDRGIVGS